MPICPGKPFSVPWALSSSHLSIQLVAFVNRCLTSTEWIDVMCVPLQACFRKSSHNSWECTGLGGHTRRTEPQVKGTLISEEPHGRMSLLDFE